MNELPEIDFEAINTYCDVLFGYLDGYVPLRLIGEKGTSSSKVRQVFHPPTVLADKIVRIAPQAAARQEAVYVVPCTVAQLGRAKEQDIVATGVLVIDTRWNGWVFFGLKNHRGRT